MVFTVNIQSFWTDFTVLPDTTQAEAADDSSGYVYSHPADEELMNDLV